MIRLSVIASAAKQSSIKPGLLRCARNDGILICALLVSLGLHMLFFRMPAVEKQSFSSPTGQTMAIKLAPKSPNKVMENKIEEIVVTKADAPDTISPKKEEEEIKPQPTELTEKLEELIVTKEAKLSTQPIPPIYPEAARRKRQEGLVLVRAQVDAQGKTRAVIVAQSSGFTLLDQAALDAVMQWNFLPATQNDKTIMAWIEVPIDFKLR